MTIKEDNTIIIGDYVSSDGRGIIILKDTSNNTISHVIRSNNNTFISHRLDGPAYIRYSESNFDDIVVEEWYYLGSHHRDDGPAIIRYTNGKKVYERWCVLGNIHRDNDEPAIIVDNIVNRSLTWYREGKIHRDNGPAKIVSYSNNQKTLSWYRDGSLHCIDHPAVISYKGDNVWYGDWYLNNHDITSIVGDLIAKLNLNREWWKWSNEDKLLFKLSLDY